VDQKSLLSEAVDQSDLIESIAASATTPDPKVVEEAIKKESDSRILAEISAEESRMQQSLVEISLSLNNTEARVDRALQYANWTVLNSTDTKTRAQQTEADALTNNETMKTLLKEFPKLNTSLIKADKTIHETNQTIATMMKDMGDAAKEKLAIKRATDAEDVLKLLQPRIMGIEHHTKSLEHIVHGGNFTLMVDDEINADIQDSLDTIQEAFHNQLDE